MDPPKNLERSETDKVLPLMVQNAEEEGTVELQVDHPTVFPPLVFSLVIASVKDASFLKTSRLVCKSWNAEATPALRDCSFVKLQENERERFDEFRVLLLNGRIGSRSDLPSPFLNFHVVASSFSHDEFYGFFLNVDVVVTELSLCYAPFPDEGCSNFHRFWACHEKTLEEVKVITSPDKDGFSDENLGISRPCGRLNIADTDGLDDESTRFEKRFFKRILPDVLLWFDRVHLVDIRLAYTDEETGLIKHLTADPGYLEHVKLLTLYDADECPSKAWDTFFSNLKELEFLTLDYGVRVSNEMISHCLSRIPNLKDLTLTFYWNKDLAVDEVRGCLSWLKKIKIRNLCPSFEEAMDLLRESLPGFQLRPDISEDYWILNEAVFRKQ